MLFKFCPWRNSGAKKDTSCNTKANDGDLGLFVVFVVCEKLTDISSDRLSNLEENSDCVPIIQISFPKINH